MQIQVHSDRNIECHEALIAQVKDVVEGALSRFSEQITRVEVHLSDANSDKKGGATDMHCMMEARLEGRRPMVATDQAASLDRAIDGAADKLARSIESTLGKLQDQEDRRTDPPQSAPELTTIG